jgi:hypothetical protein
MATNPIFVATSVIGTVRPTAASTNVDATTAVLGTDIFELVAGAANGTRVDSIKATNLMAAGNTGQATIVRVYITNTSGTNPRLFDEIAVSNTPARTATAAGPTNLVNYPGGIFLASGQKILVSVSQYSTVTTTFSAVDIVARGGNF